jgi:hypothetical protein
MSLVDPVRVGDETKQRPMSAAQGVAMATHARIAWPHRPVFVLRTTGRRQEMTRTAEGSNPQVMEGIRVSSLVAKSGSRTLSRWRHGFKSRWDYAGQRL